MNFRTTATLAAACLFASAGVARAQAPASVSTHATAPAGNEERNSLHAPATAGDAQAQFALGNYYFQTRYVGLDYAQALAWYRASAAQGFAPAQDQLGSMYKNHIGLPRSAGQGNIHGKRNVEDFTSELEEQGDGAWQNATALSMTLASTRRSVGRTFRICTAGLTLSNPTPSTRRISPASSNIWARAKMTASAKFSMPWEAWAPPNTIFRLSEIATKRRVCVTNWLE